MSSRLSDFMRSRTVADAARVEEAVGFSRPYSEQNFLYQDANEKHYLIAKIDGMFEYWWDRDGIEVAGTLDEAEVGLFEKLSGRSIEDAIA